MTKRKTTIKGGIKRRKTSQSQGEQMLEYDIFPDMLSCIQQMNPTSSSLFTRIYVALGAKLHGETPPHLHHAESQIVPWFLLDSLQPTYILIVDQFHDKSEMDSQMARIQSYISSYTTSRDNFRFGFLNKWWNDLDLNQDRHITELWISSLKERFHNNVLIANFIQFYGGSPNRLELRTQAIMHSILSMLNTDHFVYEWVVYAPVLLPYLTNIGFQHQMLTKRTNGIQLLDTKAYRDKYLLLEPL